MVKVVGIRFKSSGRMYYFDPLDFDIKAGDSVIVETARGIEFGSAVIGVTEVGESEIVAPLKPVIRKASEEDKKKNEANEAKKERSLALCQEKIDNRGLDMKLVDVEYTFDGSKVIFYFTADGRVDFRELVKDLAAVFRMRIELRQIGVRDETKMIGGIGSCGRCLCCSSFLDDFVPVSIKMAKVQNLSLNPTKISGICGRLMCCLQYENSTYVDCRKGMPDVGERIDTPEGKALVCDVDILQNKIKTRIILEESNADKPEKLSTEFYVYGKEDIRRSKKDRQDAAPKQRSKGRKISDDADITKMSEAELEAALEDE